EQSFGPLQKGLARRRIQDSKNEHQNHHAKANNEQQQTPKRADKTSSTRIVDHTFARPKTNTQAVTAQGGSFPNFSLTQNNSKGAFPPPIFPMAGPTALTTQKTTTTTAARHVRWKKLLENYFAQSPTKPNAAEVINIFLRETAGVKRTTARTYLGQLLGTLSAYDVYGLPSYCRKIYQSTATKTAIKMLDLASAQTPVAFPKALDTPAAKNIILTAKYREHYQEMTVLAIAWATASRIGDTLRLRKENIAIEGPLLRVKFVEGKSVATQRQPYTVVSSVGPFRADIVRMVRGKGPIVSNAKKSKTIIKSILQQYGFNDLRGIRRGALQQMAQSGTDIETLRRFSNHRNQRTLLRYLDFGWHWRQNDKAALKAASALW
ncbi:MAG: site-specific integrase, partial [Rhabdochlamydiaceae bacterium]